MSYYTLIVDHQEWFDYTQTPESLCKVIINRLEWEVDEVVLEPCRGSGNFYRNLPGYVLKHWCEIVEGRDFFDWTWPVDTIITNPPYRDRPGGKNMVIPFLEHSFRVARKRVVFLVNLKTFNSFKPNRLHLYQDWGWALTDLHIYSVRRWWGLYYLLTFTKGGKWLVKWDETPYE